MVFLPLPDPAFPTSDPEQDFWNLSFLNVRLCSPAGRHHNDSACFRQWRASREDAVGGVHLGVVRERDDLVVAVEGGMDLPLVAGADVREGRALGRGAEAEEAQVIATARSAAVEVGDHIAVG